VVLLTDQVISFPPLRTQQHSELDLPKPGNKHWAFAKTTDPPPSCQRERKWQYVSWQHEIQ